jgi:hypothetical protein
MASSAAPKVTESADDGSSTFHLGDLSLYRAGRIPDARIVFKTWGKLNEKGNNGAKTRRIGSGKVELICLLIARHSRYLSVPSYRFSDMVSMAD